MCSLNLEFSKIEFYTDSTIVLSWLKKESRDLKTFVSNRVSIIQSSTSIDQWHHVTSKENPADLISRGINPIKLQQCNMWWLGPHFLQLPEVVECSVNSDAENEKLFLQELKTPLTDQLCTLVNSSVSLDIINNCSSYIKLLRIIAWCKRFVNNVKNPSNRQTGNLSSSEIFQSLLCIVRVIQETAFEKEIKCLKREKDIDSRSPIFNLCPFLDQDKILRVGGRLKNSNLCNLQKQPMLIPTNHPFTFNVINYFHVLYFHAGAEATLAHLRTKFRIIAARNIVRRILFNCIKCKRIRSTPMQQVMADLPASRVTIDKVFNRTGLDFCGPFQIKTFLNRSKSQVRKVFVCVFICFVKKAVHFEIVNDLTSAAFLAALKRFVSRRGKPFEIYSDNGTNFVGANS